MGGGLEGKGERLLDGNIPGGGCGIGLEVVGAIMRLASWGGGLSVRSVV